MNVANTISIHKPYVVDLSISKDGEFLASSNNNGNLTISSLVKFSHQNNFYQHQLSTQSENIDNNNKNDDISNDDSDSDIHVKNKQRFAFSMQTNVVTFQTKKRLESVEWDPSNENTVACTSSSPFVAIYDLVHSMGEPTLELKDSEFFGDLYDVKFCQTSKKKKKRTTYL